jgi:hypothetical protein
MEILAKPDPYPWGVTMMSGDKASAVSAGIYDSIARNHGKCKPRTDKAK